MGIKEMPRRRGKKTSITGEKTTVADGRKNKGTDGLMGCGNV